MRRRFQQSRRRQPLATWSFLRPLQRRDEEEERRWRQHLRANPRLLREQRQSLGVQMGVLGILSVSCGVLAFQIFGLMRRWSAATHLTHLRWALPAAVMLLGWLAARRLLRVWAEYRSLERDRSDR